MEQGKNYEVFTDFHRNMEPGGAIMHEIHSNAGSNNPAKKVIVKFPYRFIDDHTGEEFPAGTLLEISIWSKITKKDKKWFPGGVTRMGKFCFQRLIGLVRANSPE